MIMSNPAKVAKNQRINIVAKCLIGECRLLYKKKTNTAVLGVLQYCCCCEGGDCCCMNECYNIVVVVVKVATAVV